MNIYHLAINYHTKLFIHVDGTADGNYLFSALLESDIIPISDSKMFRSDLSIHIKTLFMNGALHGH